MSKATTRKAASSITEQLHQFLMKLMKNIDSPNNISDLDLKSFLEKKTSHSESDFSLAVDLRYNTIVFTHETECIGLPSQAECSFDASNFFQIVHPSYIPGFLGWALATYMYLGSYKEKKNLNIMQFSSKIVMPLLINGKYRWVVQKATPLQLDINNNLISHFNTYIVLHDYIPTQPQNCIGSIWKNGYEEDENFSLAIRDIYSQVSTQSSLPKFNALSVTETFIASVHGQNPTFTAKQIISYLQDKHSRYMALKTLYKHDRNIISVVKRDIDSSVKNIHEAVKHLNRYGF